MSAATARGGGLLRSASGVRDLPAGGALEGGGQQFIHKTGHRFAPMPGLMVEGAHHMARDAGHVVPWSGHGGGGTDRLMRGFILI